MTYYYINTEINVYIIKLVMKKKTKITYWVISCALTKLNKIIRNNLTLNLKAAKHK